MASDKHYLTTDEVNLIQDVINTQRNRIQNDRIKQRTDSNLVTPGHYLAKTKELDGIIGLVKGNVENEDVPGRGQCLIYKLHTTYPDDTRLEEIDKVPEFEAEVYNFSEAYIDGNQYHTIQRDKYGNFWFTNPPQNMRCVLIDDLLLNSSATAFITTATIAGAQTTTTSIVTVHDSGGVLGPGEQVNALSIIYVKLNQGLWTLDNSACANVSS